jgi:hypothetical protein
MIDWVGRPIPPSRLQTILQDDASTRAYGPRPPRSLASNFEEYLGARLAVPLRDALGVIGFLRGCRYVRDKEAFGREEVWLHPEDFERTRAGDCEDHALWAWVRMIRLRHDARYTVGLREGGGHAWVTLYRRSSVTVFETTARRTGEYLFDSGEAREYEPVWSVGAEARFFWHGPLPGAGSRARRATRSGKAGRGGRGAP